MVRTGKESGRFFQDITEIKPTRAPALAGVLFTYKGEIAMNLYEYTTRLIPETYNRYMYLDGYTPEQIRYAARQKMIREHVARWAAQKVEAEANEITNVKIISEVKIR